jgi:hypothetical protein
MSNKIKDIKFGYIKMPFYKDCILVRKGEIPQLKLALCTTSQENEKPLADESINNIVFSQLEINEVDASLIDKDILFILCYKDKILFPNSIPSIFDLPNFIPSMFTRYFS